MYAIVNEFVNKVKAIANKAKYWALLGLSSEGSLVFETGLRIHALSQK